MKKITTLLLTLFVLTSVYGQISYVDEVVATGEINAGDTIETATEVVTNAIRSVTDNEHVIFMDNSDGIEILRGTDYFHGYMAIWEGTIDISADTLANGSSLLELFCDEQRVPAQTRFRMQSDWNTPTRSVNHIRLHTIDSGYIDLESPYVWADDTMTGNNVEIREFLFPDADAGANIGASGLTFQHIWQDTAHALHYGGHSDFSIGGATEKITIGSDSTVTTNNFRVGSFFQTDGNVGVRTAPSTNDWDIMCIHGSRAANFAGVCIMNTHPTGVSRLTIGMEQAVTDSGLLIQYDAVNDISLMLSRKAGNGEFWVGTTGGYLRILNSGIVQLGDDSVNYLEVTQTGDATFIGSGGLPFGSCYGNDINWTQANAVQNTWYNITDANMTDGNLNNVTHDGSGKLTVGKAGMYVINYALSYENNTANDHVEVGIEVSGSGSANAAGQNHNETKFADEEEAISCTAILDLAAGATIEIAIRTTDANTPDFEVQHLNITIVQCGGT
jgi:hypothetical protein